MRSRRRGNPLWKWWWPLGGVAVAALIAGGVATAWSAGLWAVAAVASAAYLAAQPAMTSRLALAGDASHDRGRAYADEETADRLIRRRLDARGTAVRLGMRLIAGLRSDVACG